MLIAGLGWGETGALRRDMEACSDASWHRTWCLLVTLYNDIMMYLVNVNPKYTCKICTQLQRWPGAWSWACHGLHAWSVWSDKHSVSAWTPNMSVWSDKHRVCAWTPGAWSWATGRVRYIGGKAYRLTWSVVMGTRKG